MRWELYPRVFECGFAKTWLEMQHNLRLAPNTVEAYGSSLEGVGGQGTCGPLRGRFGLPSRSSQPKGPQHSLWLRAFERHHAAEADGG